MLAEGWPSRFRLPDEVWVTADPRRVVRLIALIVLMLGALSADAFAQSRVCHDIRRGESATQAARRMTGNGRNAYQAWFQIMNPSSRFVPKSQYDRIRVGWRACVITPATELLSNAHHVEESAAADVSEAPHGSGVPEVLAAPDGTRERGRRRWTAAAARRRSRARRCRPHDAVAVRGDGRAVARVADRRRLSRSQEDRIHHRAVLCRSIRR